jgi:hypothetical protein
LAKRSLDSALPGGSKTGACSTGCETNAVSGTSRGYQDASGCHPQGCVRIGSLENLPVAGR